MSSCGGAARQLGGGWRGGRVRLPTGRIQFIPRARRMRAGPYAGGSKDCAGCSLQGGIGRSRVFRTASPQPQQDSGQHPLSARSAVRCRTAVTPAVPPHACVGPSGHQPTHASATGAQTGGVILWRRGAAIGRWVVRRQSAFAYGGASSLFRAPTGCGPGHTQAAAKIARAAVFGAA